MPQEGQGKALAAGVLVGQEADHERVLGHRPTQPAGFRPALEEQAAGAVAQFLKGAVDARHVESAISGGIAERQLVPADPRVDLEVPEMPDGEDAVAAEGRVVRPQVFDAHGLGPPGESLVAHCRRLESAGEAFADPLEILPHQGVNFRRGLLAAEDQGQVAVGHPSVAGVEPAGKSAASASQPGHEVEGQGLHPGDGQAGDPVE
ncbi:MAG: hypothetical protein H7A46_03070 [Verrucomicrobiales bacterium]|nr:hypothetical protein [Verrucomicrobiales bacterium]